MNTYHIAVDVQLKEAILDPKGKATLSALSELGFEGFTDVRIGKHIYLKIDANNEESALESARLAAHKLLSNPVIEDFTLTLI